MYRFKVYGGQMCTKALQPPHALNKALPQLTRSAASIELRILKCLIREKMLGKRIIVVPEVFTADRGIFYVCSITIAVIWVSNKIQNDSENYHTVVFNCFHSVMSRTYRMILQCPSLPRSNSWSTM